MSNFSFLLKISLMQLVFVGMAMIPIPGLATLLSVEVLYFVSTVVVFARHRHLKSILLLIPKVSQSCILLALEIFLLVFYSRLRNKDFSLTKSQQSTLQTLIFFSNIGEYVFLRIQIFSLVNVGLDTRRR